MLRRPKTILILFLICCSILAYKYRTKLARKKLEWSWQLGREISQEIQSPTSDIKIIEAFPNLVFNEPMSIKFLDDSSNTVLVAERSGKIKCFPKKSTQNTSKTILDISNKVATKFEKGLLDFVVQPTKDSSQFIYLLYTFTEKKEPFVRVSRFNFSKNTLKINKNSEVELLRYKGREHLGGALVFGNDGFLYISLGDGLETDPNNAAQNLRVFNGKLLRINVDNPHKSLYTIPKDNPFYENKQGYKTEIYAYGFRNPFRFSIDSLTNQIWLADVGQYDFEEINIVHKGGNYGWRLMEADICFNPQTNCFKAGLSSPIFSYKHGVEGFSITGGFVYRGRLNPQLYGKYIYGDYIRGAIWALSFENKKVIKNELIAHEAGNITDFGIDAEKEIYFCDFSGGRIKKIVPFQSK
ncbi:Aldose sugar dehydrogenase YliI [Emticicia aquatica]|jgi:glucose/arabinose dehydrogenase|uniref:Aldose sugar dehydrogenase YliI n=1 Tax=Emticicia aquatica TaxID=1681835 RepID=A0ABN8F3G4_9BACT|nr:PQQ-dependent sugar dehydrogenase [Emticicia aquatica]CAH0997925.1 Aldose sugar dehydrogenase YliI [Emticicia aquatica]